MVNMDLSPLSNNTQPSPKDSGVDVSSPPRREDDPCYGGGGTTPLQTPINIPPLINAKPKFFSCDRKKNVNLSELQAKELRKIIYDPRERKRKNTVSLVQAKSASNIAKQNYSIVPNETNKQSNIVLKIASDYKKSSYVKNNIDGDKYNKYENKCLESNHLYIDKNKIEQENKTKEKKYLEIKNVGGLKIKLSLISPKQANKDETEIKNNRLNIDIQENENIEIDLKKNTKLKSKKKDKKPKLLKQSQQQIENFNLSLPKLKSENSCENTSNMDQFKTLYLNETFNRTWDKNVKFPELLDVKKSKEKKRTKLEKLKVNSPSDDVSVPPLISKYYEDSDERLVKTFRAEDGRVKSLVFKLKSEKPIIEGKSENINFYSAEFDSPPSLDQLECSTMPVLTSIKSISGSTDFSMDRLLSKINEEDIEIPESYLDPPVHPSPINELDSLFVKEEDLEPDKLGSYLYENITDKFTKRKSPINGLDRPAKKLKITHIKNDYISKKFKKSFVEITEEQTGEMENGFNDYSLKENISSIRNLPDVHPLQSKQLFSYEDHDSNSYKRKASYSDSTKFIQSFEPISKSPDCVLLKSNDLESIDRINNSLPNKSDLEFLPNFEPVPKLINKTPYLSISNKDLIDLKSCENMISSHDKFVTFEPTFDAINTISDMSNNKNCESFREIINSNFLDLKTSRQQILIESDKNVQEILESNENNSTSRNIFHYESSSNYCSPSHITSVIDIKKYENNKLNDFNSIVDNQNEAVINQSDVASLMLVTKSYNNLTQSIQTPDSSTTKNILPDIEEIDLFAEMGLKSNRIRGPRLARRYNNNISPTYPTKSTHDQILPEFLSVENDIIEPPPYDPTNYLAYYSEHEDDIKHFISNQTQLCRLRRKIHRLFCCLFPEIAIPVTVMPDTEAIDCLLNLAISALSCNSQLLTSDAIQCLSHDKIENVIFTENQKTGPINFAGNGHLLLNDPILSESQNFTINLKESILDGLLSQKHRDILSLEKDIFKDFEIASPQVDINDLIIDKNKVNLSSNESQTINDNPILDKSKVMSPIIVLCGQTESCLQWLANKSLKLLSALLPDILEFQKITVTTDTNIEIDIVHRLIDKLILANSAFVGRSVNNFSNNEVSNVCNKSDSIIKESENIEQINNSNDINSFLNYIANNDEIKDTQLLPDISLDNYASDRLPSPIDDLSLENIAKHFVGEEDCDDGINSDENNYFHNFINSIITNQSPSTLNSINYVHPSMDNASINSENIDFYMK